MENHVYFKSAVDNVAVDEGLVPYVCIWKASVMLAYDDDGSKTLT
jgi:hypothetical protein